MKGFDRFIDLTVKAAGSVPAVLASVGLVAAWAAAGPYFGWSDGHQLFINTITTVITFWLCFLVLRAQNRDTLALHAKIDALVKSIRTAPNQFIGIERESEEDIERLRRTTL